MYLSTILLATITQAAAFALPASSASPLSARDGIEIGIGFSNEGFSWGTASPVDVVNMLYDQCGANGCNPLPFDVDTTIAWDGNDVPATLTVTIQTAVYPAWIKNGLVGSLANAVGQAMTHSYVRVNYDGETDVFDKYTAPQQMEVTHSFGDLEDPATITLYVEVTVNDSGFSAFCTGATGVGSALGGLINPALGAGFSLAALFCTD